MKHTRLLQATRFAIAWACLLIPASCAKQTTAPGTASLTVFNAVSDSKPLVTNFKGGNPFEYFHAVLLYYKSTGEQNQFAGLARSQPLALYQYPDTLATSVPLFNLVLDLPIGSIHSLLLTGTVAKPDTLFVKDEVPFHSAADSTTGIRFVNLSPGSGPVNISIKGQNGGPEVANLPYKGITAFKIYGTKAVTADYVFEFRDAASGALITSYTTINVYNPPDGKNFWRYMNHTLALVGQPGGTGLQQQTIISITY